MGTLPQALFFSRKMAPIFLEALNLWVRCRRRLFFQKNGPQILVDVSGWPRAMSCHVMASRAMPGHIFTCHAIFLRVMPCHEYSMPCHVRIFLEKMTPVFEKISKIYAHGAFFWLLYAPGAGWVGSIIDQIHQGK